MLNSKKKCNFAALFVFSAKTLSIKTQKTHTKHTMVHLTNTLRSATFLLGTAMLMLFFFCAPMHAQTPTFKSTSSYGIANPNYSSQQLDPTTIGHQTYRSTIYTPFGSGTPSSNNPSGNSGSGGSGDPDDDVGIPGWADTPSEPLPIGDTLPLFLFAAAMIAIIAIRQRKQHRLTTQTQSTNTNNNTTQHMTTRKQTYQSLRQKLFLLLAFVCIAGQVSGQNLNTINYYKQELFNRSQANSNRPTNFPRKDAGNYTGSFQGAHANGAFYTYDRWIPGLVKITDSGTVSVAKSYPNWVESKTEYATRAGVCCDNAGNLIINPYYGKLVIFSKGNLDSAKELTYAFGTTASCNYISASGDVMSSTGGYIYFFPNEKSTVYVVKIVNGAKSGTYTTVGTTKCKGYSSSYVIPLDNTSTNFIYHSRHANSNDKYYHYNGSTHTELCTSNTLGGTSFTLGGVQMFIQTANDSYKGGWRMSTLSTPATHI